MYRAIAAILATAGLAARAAVAYGPIGCDEAPPCGCEPIVICDPCVVTESAPPKAPDELPAPPQASQAPPQPAQGNDQQAPATANEFPSPPNLNTPVFTPPTPPVTSPAEDAASADEPATPARPTEETPATPDQPTTQEAPPADDASRYAAPPAEAPTTPATDPYEGLFPSTDAPAESEAPATEPPAAEETPTSEESPRTPDYDELFPPSSGTEVLSAPGGWASETPRSWKDADGRVLAVGRIAGATAQQVILVGDDETEHAFPYAALSNADLRFLREQVAARRAELTTPGDRDRLLAGQQ